MEPSNSSKKREAPGGASHSAVTRKDVHVCGDNEFNVLGLPELVYLGEDDFAEIQEPIDLYSLKGAPIKHMSIGNLHAFIGTGHAEQDKLFSWGVNDDKVLGRDSEKFFMDGTSLDLTQTPQIVPLPPIRIEKLCCGDHHAAVLSTKKELYIWGDYCDKEGKSALRHKIARPTLYTLFGSAKIQTIDSFRSGTLVLLDNFRLYCVGLLPWDKGRFASSSEELGEGFTEDEIGAFLVCDDKVSRIWSGAGADHWFYETTEGNIRAMGANHRNQLGFVSTQLLGDGFFAVETLPVDVQFEGRVEEIKCSSDFSLALVLVPNQKGTDDRKVFSTGSNDCGQLGFGKDVQFKAVFSEVIFFSSLVVTDPVLLIASSDKSSYAVLRSGRALVFGYNGMFNFGLGHDQDIFMPTRLNGGSVQERFVSMIGGGAQFSVIITQHNTKVGRTPISAITKAERDQKRGAIKAESVKRNANQRNSFKAILADQKKIFGVHGPPKNRFRARPSKSQKTDDLDDESFDDDYVNADDEDSDYAA